MKKITHFKCIVLTTFLVPSFLSFKTQTVPSAALVRTEKRADFANNQRHFKTIPSAGNNAPKTAASTCVDKINYVGNTASVFFQVGGYQPNFPFVDGVYQVYGPYFGSVLGVEFEAAKFPGTSPTMSIAVFALDGAGDPDPNVILGSPVAVSINNTANTTYSVTFSAPVPVPNGSQGFAIGLFRFNYALHDSVKIIGGANTYPGWVKSYVTESLALPVYGAKNYFNYDGNFFLRPTVTTTVDPSWTSAKTSTGCGAPAVFEFTNTSTNPVYYVGTQFVNPQGILSSMNFGDGSPTLNFTNTIISTNTVFTHTYTSVGNYVASLTHTYIGWTNNCIESKTVPIVVDLPKPSFSYTTNGLVLMVTNTSQNMSNYVWNFGDLSTSAQNQPGPHTFSSPGTYVVELEALSSCGTVRYSVSITVPSNTSGETGIARYAVGSSQLKLFPNPAGSILHLRTDLPGERDAKMEIYSSLGEFVKTIGADPSHETITVDISDLAKGLYFVKVKGAEGSVSATFIKE